MTLGGTFPRCQGDSDRRGNAAVPFNQQRRQIQRLGHRRTLGPTTEMTTTTRAVDNVASWQRVVLPPSLLAQICVFVKYYLFIIIIVKVGYPAQPRLFCL